MFCQSLHLILFGVLALILSFPAPAALAQLKIEARIEILPVAEGKSIVRVEGKINVAQNRWTFLDRYADVQNLNQRVEQLEFFDSQNHTIDFQKLNSSEYQTANGAVAWASEINLAVPARIEQTAHISWLSKDYGLLMPGDLLPDLKNENGEPVPAAISFVLPQNWTIVSSEKISGDNSFQTADFTKAVFLAGNFSVETKLLGKTEIQLARVGDWSFTAGETLDLAIDLLTRYKNLFGAVPIDKIQIIMLPFAQKFGGEQWRAETRGSTVLILSAVSPYKSRAVSKLHEQLRHELFHLWIPNALRLSGNYDWFYEGFALYEALKVGTAARYIRFEDFLDALSRAFDITRSISQNNNLNLLDASRSRWSTGNNSDLVYAKGMLIAFLCDLTLLGESRGRRSLDNVFRQLFQQHQSPSAIVNANAAILAMLKSAPQLQIIIENFVEKPGAIEVEKLLTESGLQNVSRGRFVRLQTQEKLSGRQKKLLENFGYQQ